MLQDEADRSLARFLHGRPVHRLHEPMPEIPSLDRRYVEQHSIWLDLRILFKTIKVVVARDGAR